MQCISKGHCKKNNPALKKRKRFLSVVPSLPEDYPWKVLGWVVDDLSEVLEKEDVDLVQTIVRDRDFSTYLRLSEIWGLQSINQQNVLSLEEIRAKYTLAALLKKFRFKGDRDQRILAAKKKFLAAEEACKFYNLSGYKNLVAPKDDSIPLLLSHARSFLAKVLGEHCPTLKQIMKSSRHGPGSNLDTCDGKKSAYDKYANWPYSCTAAAIPIARFLIQSDKRWLGALENDYRRRYNIPPTAILDRVTFWEKVFKVVEGNKITFVPKDARTERSIAIEPCMNLMLQLGVEDHIRQRLKRFDIDLDNQEKNQWLARVGSLHNNYVTIDLAAASDSLCLMLCKILLPDDWYTYLMKLRSPVGKLGEETIVYSKISSMGNGYTFALESAVFAAICYAAIKLTKSKVDFVQDFCVFGDDLIIKSEYANALLFALPLFGFSINTDKSFVEGPVRESCGTDWYKGKSIRPVFLSETPTDIKGLFTDLNRLKRLLNIRFGLENSKTHQMMLRWIPENFLEFQGPLSDEDFDSYIHVSSFKGFTYKNGCWEHKRLLYEPAERSCHDFLLGKLAHDLKPYERPRFFEKARSKGSRFAILSSDREVVRETVSRVDFWRDEYTDYITPEQGPATDPVYWVGGRPLSYRKRMTLGLIPYSVAQLLIISELVMAG